LEIRQIDGADFHAEASSRYRPHDERAVMTTERRPATPTEAKALAHPVRQRILRLCGLEELTNQQLAGRLHRDPATVLYHVRKLVDAGFLAPVKVRAGPSGALEKPYRATGKSWRIDSDPERTGVGSVAMLDAVREEVATDPAAVVMGSRFVVQLPEAELAAWLEELQQRIDALVTRSRELRAAGQELPAHAATVVVHRIDGPAGPPAAAPRGGPGDVER
jgi:predicted ArsR family transcriptional regulator